MKVWIFLKAQNKHKIIKCIKTPRLDERGISSETFYKNIVTGKFGH